MKVILTHIRNPIPAYVFNSHKHFRNLNKDIEVDFLVDFNLITEEDKNNFKSININLVDSNQYVSDELLIKFNEVCFWNNKLTEPPNTGYPSQSYFWHSVIEKWYYILAHMIKNNFDNVFHFENDNLIYKNLNECEKYFSKFDKFSIPKRNDIHFVSSVAYIPNIESLRLICLDMIEFLNKGEEGLLKEHNVDWGSDMALFYLSHIKGNLKELPTLPSDNHELIFDGLGYGPYICGTNIFNSPGFIFTSENDKIGNAISNKEISPHFDFSEKKPYVIFNSKYYELFNLHVHSKRVELYI